MKLKAYAKINLSLGVIGCRSDGYHNILSLMQNINLFDDVEIEKCLKNGTKYNFSHCSICNTDVYLCMDDKTIPVDGNNLIIKAAEAILKLVKEKYEDSNIPEIWINVQKKLPVAAGIAGGSGNAAITILGINALVGNIFTLEELMKIGESVGADVPFSIFMNAKKNENKLQGLRGIERASVAAEVSGIGDIVKAADPIHRYTIMINPGIEVSTKTVYQGMDGESVEKDKFGLFVNQLEKYTLEKYEEAATLKRVMKENLNADVVLMSGSGPTMVAYYESYEEASKDFESMKNSEWLLKKYRCWLTETGC